MPASGAVAGVIARIDAPEWKYVSVRRLVLFIEGSIDRGTRWAVFEPNDEPLRRAVRSSIEGFLLELFRHGPSRRRRLAPPSSSAATGRR
ncbi:MAG: phage tail sheath C-terminal domain-containing protein [Gaiellaceae bacterium]